MITKRKRDSILNDICVDVERGNMSTKDAIEETTTIGTATTFSTSSAYNVQIWVGLQETYNTEKLHTICEAEKICEDFVNEVKDCVTITPTKFKYVCGGENGFVVGWISYPRFPRKRKEIRNRAFVLAEKLMTKLNQYRVTITTPRKSYMLENNNVKR